MNIDGLCHGQFGDSCHTAMTYVFSKVWTSFETAVVLLRITQSVHSRVHLLQARDPAAVVTSVMKQFYVTLSVLFEARIALRYLHDLGFQPKHVVSCPDLLMCVSLNFKKTNRKLSEII